MAQGHGHSVCWSFERGLAMEPTHAHPGHTNPLAVLPPDERYELGIPLQLRQCDTKVHTPLSTVLRGSRQVTVSLFSKSVI